MQYFVLKGVKVRAYRAYHPFIVNAYLQSSRGRNLMIYIQVLEDLKMKKSSLNHSISLLLVDSALHEMHGSLEKTRGSPH